MNRSLLSYGETPSGQVSIAQGQAAEVDLKRAQLQSRILAAFGARNPTPEQVTRMIEQLTMSTPGIRVDVFAFALGNPYTESDDSLSFERVIIRALSSARMDVLGWTAMDCTQSVGAANVIVEVVNLTSGMIPTDWTVPLAIKNALEPFAYPSVGYALYPLPAMCRVEPLDTGKAANRKADATIRITVGRKVAPVLTPQLLGIEQPK